MEVIMAVLMHIEHFTCPECGAKCTESRETQQHSNGEWNEYRKFECGFILHYSPNFMRVCVDSPCTRSEAARAMFNKRVAADLKLRKVITKLDVDDDFKRQIHKALKGNLTFHV